MKRLLAAAKELHLLLVELFVLAHMVKLFWSILSR
jgi:hypothetical protein